MTHSLDMADRGKAGGQKAVNHYFQLSEPIALFVHELFKVAFPDVAQKYAAAFKKGEWQMVKDLGPFWGQALVYKMPVDVHQDGLDDGLLAMFPCGFFTEGRLDFPDLGIKLQ